MLPWKLCKYIVGSLLSGLRRLGRGQTNLVIESEKVYFVVMMWARYLYNDYCDHNLILAFDTYTYF